MHGSRGRFRHKIICQCGWACNDSRFQSGMRACEQIPNLSGKEDFCLSGHSKIGIEGSGREERKGEWNPINDGTKLAGRAKCPQRGADELGWRVATRRAGGVLSERQSLRQAIQQSRISNVEAGAQKFPFPCMCVAGLERWKDLRILRGAWMCRATGCC
jgi:hypothetical protein